MHSLIMWLIILSLTPHNLHLLFCYILSVLALTLFVLMVLFCAPIKRDSISLLRFSLVGFRLCVAWNVQSIVFLPIFVYWLFLFCRSSSCLYCFCWLWSIFLRAFLCSLLVVISMYRRYLECWQVLFLCSFLTHTVCVHHLWNVRPYSGSL